VGGFVKNSPNFGCGCFYSNDMPKSYAVMISSFAATTLSKYWEALEILIHNWSIGLVYFGLACGDRVLGAGFGVNNQTGDI